MNTRVRFILRIEVAGRFADQYEALLIRFARTFPGARLSRTEYEEHGDHLRWLRRKKVV